MKIYKIDGKGKWELVYGPILSNYDGSDVYEEPRYLFKDLTRKGCWTKEIPIRYAE